MVSRSCGSIIASRNGSETSASWATAGQCPHSAVGRSSPPSARSLHRQRGTQTPSADLWWRSHACPCARLSTSSSAAGSFPAPDRSQSDPRSPSLAHCRHPAPCRSASDQQRSASRIRTWAKDVSMSGCELFACGGPDCGAMMTGAALATAGGSDDETVGDPATAIARDGRGASDKRAWTRNERARARGASTRNWNFVRDVMRASSTRLGLVW